MRIPLPSFGSDDKDPEEVKWPTVDFEHDMAAKIADGKKKKKKKKGKS